MVKTLTIIWHLKDISHSEHHSDFIRYQSIVVINLNTLRSGKTRIEVMEV